METLQTIAARRSVRAYAPTQIEESALETILASGSAAAMGMAAFDRLHMAVVQDKDLMARLNEDIKAFFAKRMPGRGGSDCLMGAPTIVLISCKDPENTPMPGMHYINAGCVAENMMLAATELGLGSVVLGVAALGLADDAALIADLGIPDGFTPLFGILFGYAADGKELVKDMSMKIAVSRV